MTISNLPSPDVLSSAPAAPVPPSVEAMYLASWRLWQALAREDEMERAYVCTKCGASGVKLWREYQTCADATGLYCQRCAEADQGEKLPERGDSIGWLVPAVPADGGTFWGYTSVPEDRAAWWRALPAEASPAPREVR